MKKILLIISIVMSLFSFSLANNHEIDENTFPVHEEEMTIELTQSEMQSISTQEKREFRHSKKQDIKSEMLDLYKEKKQQETRTDKKEIKGHISTLKRELWTINSKIISSYKLQIQRFFGLK